MTLEPDWQTATSPSGGTSPGSVLMLGPAGTEWDRSALLAEGLTRVGAAVRVVGDARVDVEQVLREPPPTPGPKILLVTAPTEQAVRRLGSARLTGWVSVLDVDRPWTAGSGRGMPGWYHDSFLGHLARHADVVSAASGGVADFLRSRYRVDPVVVPNGCPPLPSLGLPVGGTEVGDRTVLGVPIPAETMGFHWETVIKAATALRAHDPDAYVEVSAREPPPHLELPAGITVVDARSPEQLRIAAAGWRAALLPLRPGTLAGCADPVEVYACQAWGIPVLAPMVPALFGRAGVRVTDNIDELVAALIEVWTGAPALAHFALDGSAANDDFAHAARLLLSLSGQVHSQARPSSPPMLPGITTTDITTADPYGAATPNRSAGRAVAGRRGPLRVSRWPWRRPRLVFAYGQGIAGGVSTQLVNRYAEFSSAFDVSVLFTHDLGMGAAFPAGRARVTPDDETRAQAIRELHPDIFAVIDDPDYLRAWRAAGRPGRCVVEVHTTYPAALTYLDDPELLDGVDRIICVSDYVRGLLLERGVQRLAPIHVVPNCLDDMWRAELAVPPTEGPAILWVGRVNGHKRWRSAVEVLAEGTRRVRAAGRDARPVLIGGHTTSATELRGLTSRLGDSPELELATWWPRVDYPLMPGVLSAVAGGGGVLVSATRDESFGMAIAEALLRGCPVVAPRVGALPELLPDVALYPPGDLLAAADQVARAVLDPGLRAELLSTVDAVRELTRPATALAAYRAALA
jgi:glycosyltransferase involved in cell wall biosynthesis